MRKNNDKLRPANLKQTKSNNSKRAGSLIKVVFLSKSRITEDCFCFSLLLLLLLLSDTLAFNRLCYTEKKNTRKEGALKCNNVELLYNAYKII